MKLNASSRSSLIRLASSMPKGSKERRALLARLKTGAGKWRLYAARISGSSMKGRPNLVAEGSESQLYGVSELLTSLWQIQSGDVNEDGKYFTQGTMVKVERGAEKFVGKPEAARKELQKMIGFDPTDTWDAVMMPPAEKLRPIEDDSSDDSWPTWVLMEDYVEDWPTDKDGLPVLF